MLEVLELPSCSDIEQGKELIKWAFERDSSLNMDLIIRQVVDEIYKESEADSSSPLTRKCELTYGTWIKQFGTIREEHEQPPLSDKISHHDNSLNSSRMSVLGKSICRSQG